MLGAEIVASAALTSDESRWMSGGIAIAAVTAVALSAVMFHGRRPTQAAIAYGWLAAVASTACGGVVGWLAAPYKPDGTLNDLAAGFSGDGGLLSVLIGAYLWLPLAALAAIAWIACRHAALRGRAGALGLSVAALTMAVGGLALTLADRPAATTILASLGLAAGAVAVAAEMSARPATARERDM